MQWIRLSLDDHEHFPLSYCRKVVFAVLALAILVISIYSNSLDCTWQFDDEPNITENTNLHMGRITWDGFISALYSNPSSPGELHRPAACLSFALNYYADGLDVFGYHIVNICVHFLSSLFLFLFILHTLNLPRLKGRYSRHSYSIALISTVLWAVNPIQTQAVTYIVQRMASMAGMFYIMAMYFYLKARTAKKGLHSKAFFVLCFLAFAMAVGSKENAVMLPLCLFLYEILLLQETGMRHIKKNIRTLFLVMLGILVLGFAMIYSHGGNIFSFLDGYADRPFTPAQRLLTEPRIIIFYISLLLYPVSTRLNLAHAVQVSNSLTEPLSTAVSIVLILGALILVTWLSRKRPLMSFCIFFFFLNHLIESTVFPLELVFEHRNYIPSMLFFVPIAVGWCRLFDYYTIKGSMQYVLSGFLVLVLIGLGHSTFIRNMTWKNPESLWIDAVEKSPNLVRTHNNLGRHYFQKGNMEKAVFQLEKALKMPAYNRRDEKFITNYNLGRIYRELKDYGKALQYYKKAAALNPFYAP
ncbi:MAG: tetratricopeptide repeat protein, partial [Deltaproteobacteria bacterium]|nr:tetratricopeptide repeat protein [Deltaproteobacteria bacterium]